MTAQAAEEIRALFGRHNFEICGVSSAEPAFNEKSEFEQWIAAGYHGTMSYLENHAKAKYEPGKVLGGCNSIIFTALNYYQPEDKVPEGHARIAKYAWGRDYHKVLGKSLKRIAKRLRELYPAERFLAFTDATPLAERTFAARAGAGFIGRNTLLIDRTLGSFFVLGGIASTLDMTAIDEDEGKIGAGGFGNAACPRGCTRCIDACPTDALIEPHRIDARLCISYLTIEHKGAIPPEKWAPIGNRLFGCDVCQDVCPFNAVADKTYVADFLSPIAGPSLSIAEVLTINNQADFMERFAGSPVMRTKRSGLVRNACIVAANLGLTELIPELDALTGDSDPTIARHAAMALGVLKGQ